MFIKLTGLKNDSSVFIRIDRIDVIDKIDIEIMLQDREGIIAVKETPEQIMEMIENARN